ncbi:MAG: hypothetical protein JXA96_04370 [Sedimentisphaerales bacterium]|nr:hypothetical protein [Sedimentisphaerales bacterium]
MTSIKKLKQFIKNASVKSDSEMNQKVLSELLEEIPDKANKRREIMKPRIPRLAIAAVIIFAFAMFTMLILNSQNDQKIEIPAELAAMSAEELVNLNYHPEDSNFSSEVIKAALQQALEKLSPEQVLAIASNLSSGNGSGMRMAAERMAPPIYPMADMVRSYTPFPQVVESTDIFVKARLLDTKINVEDIIQALLDAQVWIEDFSSKYRVTMQLEVLDSLPEGALKKGQKLDVPTVINEETLNGLKNGAEYFISMMQTDEGPRFLYPFAGFFNISEFETTDPKVLWTFFSDALDILLLGNQPAQEVIEYWNALLDTDYYGLAIEYKKFLPDENLSTTSILDAIENKHNDILEQIQPDFDYYKLRDTRRNFTQLEPLIKQLLLAKNKDANERLISILSREDSFLELMNNLPDDLLPPGLVMDAIERKYQYTLSVVEATPDYNIRRSPIGNDLMGLAFKASDIMIKAHDKDSIARMISLLEQDMQLNRMGHFFRSINYHNKDFVKMLVLLSMALDSNNPSKRMLEIYEKYKDTPIVIESYTNVVGRFRPTPPKAQIDYACGLITEIVEQAATIATDEVYAMLYQILQNPSTYNLYDVETISRNWRVVGTRESNFPAMRIWQILGESGSYDIQSYLIDFLSDSDLSKIGTTLPPDLENPEQAQFGFERAAFETLQQLPAAGQPTHKDIVNLLILIYQRHKDNQECIKFTADTLEKILQPNDTECIPVLQELLLADDNISKRILNLIANKMPDPVFIDELIPAYEKSSDIKLLNVLADFGDKEKAITMALAQDTFSIDLLDFLFENGNEEKAKDMALDQLDKAISDDSADNFRSNINQISQIITFLGRTGDTSLAKIIEHYTDNDAIKELHDRHPYYILNADSIYKLQEKAIVALTHLLGKDAIGPLRKVYKNTKEIRARSISTLCLYYLGDNTGQELIDAYVKGSYKQIPEYAIRNGYDYSDGQLFQAHIISSLRSEKTDALILEKLQNYVDFWDCHSMLSSQINRDFFEEYKKQILPILVNQLNNRNKDTCSNAHGILKEATGQDFGFDPEKYHGYQDDIIQQWRDYIEREY